MQSFTEGDLATIRKLFYAIQAIFRFLKEEKQNSGLASHVDSYDVTPSAVLTEAMTKRGHDLSDTSSRLSRANSPKPLASSLSSSSSPPAAVFDLSAANLTLDKTLSLTALPSALAEQQRLWAELAFMFWRVAGRQRLHLLSYVTADPLVSLCSLQTALLSFLKAVFDATEKSSQMAVMAELGSAHIFFFLKKLCTRQCCDVMLRGASSVKDSAVVTATSTTPRSGASKPKRTSVADSIASLTAFTSLGQTLHEKCCLSLRLGKHLQWLSQLNVRFCDAAASMDAEGLLMPSSFVSTAREVLECLLVCCEGSTACAVELLTSEPVPCVTHLMYGLKLRILTGRLLRPHQADDSVALSAKAEAFSSSSTIDAREGVPVNISGTPFTPSRYFPVPKPSRRAAATAAAIARVKCTTLSRENTDVFTNTSTMASSNTAANNCSSSLHPISLPGATSTAHVQAASSPANDFGNNNSPRGQHDERQTTSPLTRRPPPLLARSVGGSSYGMNNPLLTRSQLTHYLTAGRTNCFDEILHFALDVVVEAVAVTRAGEYCWAALTLLAHYLQLSAKEIQKPSTTTAAAGKVARSSSTRPTQSEALPTTKLVAMYEVTVDVLQTYYAIFSQALAPPSAVVSCLLLQQQQQQRRRTSSFQPSSFAGSPSQPPPAGSYSFAGQNSATPLLVPSFSVSPFAQAARGTTGGGGGTSWREGPEADQGDMESASDLHQRRELQVQSLLKLDIASCVRAVLFGAPSVVRCDRALLKAVQTLCLLDNWSSSNVEGGMGCTIGAFRGGPLGSFTNTSMMVDSYALMPLSAGRAVGNRSFQKSSHFTGTSQSQHVPDNSTIPHMEKGFTRSFAGKNANLAASPLSPDAKSKVSSAGVGNQSIALAKSIFKNIFTTRKQKQQKTAKHHHHHHHHGGSNKAPHGTIKSIAAGSNDDADDGGDGGRKIGENSESNSSSSSGSSDTDLENATNRTDRSGGDGLSRQTNTTGIVEERVWMWSEVPSYVALVRELLRLLEDTALDARVSVEVRTVAVLLLSSVAFKDAYSFDLYEGRLALKTLLTLLVEQSRKHGVSTEVALNTSEMNVDASISLEPTMPFSFAQAVMTARCADDNTASDNTMMNDPPVAGTPHVTSTPETGMQNPLLEEELLPTMSVAYDFLPARPRLSSAEFYGYAHKSLDAIARVYTYLGVAPLTSEALLLTELPLQFLSICSAASASLIAPSATLIGGESMPYASMTSALEKNAWRVITLWALAVVGAQCDDDLDCRCMEVLMLVLRYLLRRSTSFKAVMIKTGTNHSNSQSHDQNNSSSTSNNESGSRHDDETVGMSVALDATSPFLELRPTTTTDALASSLFLHMQQQGYLGASAATTARPSANNRGSCHRSLEHSGKDTETGDTTVGSPFVTEPPSFLRLSNVPFLGSAAEYMSMSGATYRGNPGRAGGGVDDIGPSSFPDSPEAVGEVAMDSLASIFTTLLVRRSVTVSAEHIATLFALCSQNDPSLIRLGRTCIVHSFDAYDVYPAYARIIAGTDSSLTIQLLVLLSSYLRSGELSPATLHERRVWLSTYGCIDAAIWLITRSLESPDATSVFLKVVPLAFRFLSAYEPAQGGSPCLADARFVELVSSGFSLLQGAEFFIIVAQAVFDASTCNYGVDRLASTYTTQLVGSYHVRSPNCAAEKPVFLDLIPTLALLAERHGDEGLMGNLIAVTERILVCTSNVRSSRLLTFVLQHRLSQLLPYLEVAPNVIEELPFVEPASPSAAMSWRSPWMAQSGKLNSFVPLSGTSSTRKENIDEHAREAAVRETQGRQKQQSQQGQPAHTAEKSYMSERKEGEKEANPLAYPQRGKTHVLRDFWLPILSNAPERSEIRFAITGGISIDIGAWPSSGLSISFFIEFHDVYTTVPIFELCGGEDGPHTVLVCGGDSLQLLSSGRRIVLNESHALQSFKAHAWMSFSVTVSPGTGTLAVFLNGVKAGEGLISVPAASSKATVHVGVVGREITDALFAIGDVLMWDYPLTLAQVQTQYAGVDIRRGGAPRVMPDSEVPRFYGGAGSAATCSTVVASTSLAPLGSTDSKSGTASALSFAANFSATNSASAAIQHQQMLPLYHRCIARYTPCCGEGQLLHNMVTASAMESSLPSKFSRSASTSLGATTTAGQSSGKDGQKGSGASRGGGGGGGGGGGHDSAQQQQQQALDAMPHCVPLVAKIVGRHAPAPECWVDFYQLWAVRGGVQHMLEWINEVTTCDELGELVALFAETVRRTKTFSNLDARTYLLLGHLLKEKGSLVTHRVCDSLLYLGTTQAAASLNDEAHTVVLNRLLFLFILGDAELLAAMPRTCALRLVNRMTGLFTLSSTRYAKQNTLMLVPFRFVDRLLNTFVQSASRMPFELHEALVACMKAMVVSCGMDEALLHGLVCAVAQLTPSAMWVTSTRNARVHVCLPYLRHVRAQLPTPTATSLTVTLLRALIECVSGPSSTAFMAALCRVVDLPWYVTCLSRFADPVSVMYATRLFFDAVQQSLVLRQEAMQHQATLITALAPHAIHEDLVLLLLSITLGAGSQLNILSDSHSIQTQLQHVLSSSFAPTVNPIVAPVMLHIASLHLQCVLAQAPRRWPYHLHTVRQRLRRRSATQKLRLYLMVVRLASRLMLWIRLARYPKTARHRVEELHVDGAEVIKEELDRISGKLRETSPLSSQRRGNASTGGSSGTCKTAFSGEVVAQAPPARIVSDAPRVRSEKHRRAFAVLRTCVLLWIPLQMRRYDWVFKGASSHLANSNIASFSAVGSDEERGFTGNERSEPKVTTKTSFAYLPDTPLPGATTSTAPASAPSAHRDCGSMFLVRMLRKYAAQPQLFFAFVSSPLQVSAIRTLIRCTTSDTVEEQLERMNAYVRAADPALFRIHPLLCAREGVQALMAASSESAAAVVASLSRQGSILGLHTGADVRRAAEVSAASATTVTPSMSASTSAIVLDADTRRADCVAEGEEELCLTRNYTATQLHTVRGADASMSPSSVANSSLVEGPMSITEEGEVGGRGGASTTDMQVGSFIAQSSLTNASSLTVENLRAAAHASRRERATASREEEESEGVSREEGRERDCEDDAKSTASFQSTLSSSSSSSSLVRSTSHISSSIVAEEGELPHELQMIAASAVSKVRTKASSLSHSQLSHSQLVENVPERRECEPLTVEDNRMEEEGEEVGADDHAAAAAAAVTRKPSDILSSNATPTLSDMRERSAVYLEHLSRSLRAPGDVIRSEAIDILAAFITSSLHVLPMTQWIGGPSYGTCGGFLFQILLASSHNDPGSPRHTPHATPVNFSTSHGAAMGRGDTTTNNNNDIVNSSESASTPSDNYANMLIHFFIFHVLANVRDEHSSIALRTSADSDLFSSPLGLMTSSERSNSFATFKSWQTEVASAAAAASNATSANGMLDIFLYNISRFTELIVEMLSTSVISLATASEYFLSLLVFSKVWPRRYQEVLKGQVLRSCVFVLNRPSLQSISLDTIETIHRVTTRVMTAEWCLKGSIECFLRVLYRLYVSLPPAWMSEAEVTQRDFYIVLILRHIAKTYSGTQDLQKALNARTLTQRFSLYDGFCEALARGEGLEAEVDAFRAFSKYSQKNASLLDTLISGRPKAKADEALKVSIKIRSEYIKRITAYNSLYASVAEIRDGYRVVQLCARYRREFSSYIAVTLRLEQAQENWLMTSNCDVSPRRQQARFTGKEKKRGTSAEASQLGGGNTVTSTAADSADSCGSARACHYFDLRRNYATIVPMCHFHDALPQNGSRDRRSLCDPASGITGVMTASGESVVRAARCEEQLNHILLLLPPLALRSRPHLIADVSPSFVDSAIKLTPSALNLLQYLIQPNDVLRFISNGFRIHGIHATPCLILLTDTTMRVIGFSRVTQAGDIILCQYEKRDRRDAAGRKNRDGGGGGGRASTARGNSSGASGYKQSYDGENSEGVNNNGGDADGDHQDFEQDNDEDDDDDDEDDWDGTHGGGVSEDTQSVAASQGSVYTPAGAHRKRSNAFSFSAMTKQIQRLLMDNRDARKQQQVRRDGTRVAQSVRQSTSAMYQQLFWSYSVKNICEVRCLRYVHMDTAVSIGLLHDDGPMLSIMDATQSMNPSAREQFLTVLRGVLKQQRCKFSDDTKRPVALRKMLVRWAAGSVSNFDYLYFLNKAAGRTLHDYNQYPVFPWVLADYEASVLDLENVRTFRDLAFPIGAQTQTRRDAITAFYENTKEVVDLETNRAFPFHHGTHYSTSGAILYFMLRVEPFTTFAKIFQGGTFDIATRLFDSLGASFASCVRGPADCKELLPEFYSNNQFLLNNDHLPFGEKSDGTVVNDVQLPPWARGSVQVFTAVMRYTLECPYVTNRIHQWIDLIFGVRRRGPLAAERFNLFQRMTYGEEVAKALADAKTRHECDVIVAEVENFGQTPLQLFQERHPSRSELEPVKRGLSSAGNNNSSISTSTNATTQVALMSSMRALECEEQAARATAATAAGGLAGGSSGVSGDRQGSVTAATAGKASGATYTMAFERESPKVMRMLVLAKDDRPQTYFTLTELEPQVMHELPAALVDRFCGQHSAVLGFTRVRSSGKLLACRPRVTGVDDTDHVLCWYKHEPRLARYSVLTGVFDSTVPLLVPDDSCASFGVVVASTRESLILATTVATTAGSSSGSGSGNRAGPNARSTGHGKEMARSSSLSISSPLKHPSAQGVGERQTALVNTSITAGMTNREMRKSNNIDEDTVSDGDDETEEDGGTAYCLYPDPESPGTTITCVALCHHTHRITGVVTDPIVSRAVTFTRSPFDFPIVWRVQQTHTSLLCRLDVGALLPLSDASSGNSTTALDDRSVVAVCIGSVSVHTVVVTCRHLMIFDSNGEPFAVGMLPLSQHSYTPNASSSVVNKGTQKDTTESQPPPPMLEDDDGSIGVAVDIVSLPLPSHVPPQTQVTSNAGSSPRMPLNASGVSSFLQPPMESTLSTFLPNMTAIRSFETREWAAGIALYISGHQDGSIGLWRSTRLPPDTVRPGKIAVVDFHAMVHPGSGVGASDGLGAVTAIWQDTLDVPHFLVGFSSGAVREFAFDDCLLAGIDSGGSGSSGGGGNAKRKGGKNLFSH